MKKRDFVIEEAEYKLIVKKLNTLYNLIVDTAKLDSQRRISLPQDVRERVDNNRILLQGKGESIALFPNDYSYNYYCEENLEKGLRI